MIIFPLSRTEEKVILWTSWMVLIGVTFLLSLLGILSYAHLH